MDNYDFSVVMAVYNTEPFLCEAIDSLIHQTIGFKRIQLILVDDGSKDKSGAICDEYKKKYPDNIVVIHKENGGVSSARNAGLSHIKGRYVNFMDSDDKMGRDAFQKVYDFFKQHGEETDVAAIPMRFFDRDHGEHFQNEKFGFDVDVLSLFEYPFVINMAVNASFVKAEAVDNGIMFDTGLRYAEDAKFALTILLRKMRLGLVKNTTYWYRKRSSGEESAIQSSFNKIEWYIPCLNHFSRWALHTAKTKYGYIPKFVQNEVMYDLQWRWIQKHIPINVLTPQEEQNYMHLLCEITKQIDDDVILHQHFLDSLQKTYLISLKYGSNPRVQDVDCEGRYVDSANKNIKAGDMELLFGDTLASAVSDMTTVFAFLTIDKHENKCTLEGYHTIYGTLTTAVEPVLIVNDVVISCETTSSPNVELKILKNTIGYTVGFKATFLLDELCHWVIPAVLMDGLLIVRKNIEFGDFFPVSDVYQNAYALLGNRMVTFTDNHLVIAQRPGWTDRTARECRFLHEIWQKNLRGGRKAVFGRLYCHLVKPMKRRKLWIVSDRVMKADDNGEAMFRYIIDHKPKNTRVIFAIHKNSKDYARMRKIGECVSAMSFRHKLLHLVSDVTISSHADDVMFRGYNDGLRDLTGHHHFVFLQHGITKDDVSEWLQRYNQNISGFVTAAQPEWKSIIEGNYGYSDDEVWLTGFPRYDRLYQNEKNIITIMPTWRRYLTGIHDGKTGIRSIKEKFEQQDYYSFYDKLLNSDRLLSVLAQYGYTLQFFPHPDIQPYLDKFHHDPRVTFLTWDTSYRDVYAVSNLVVTDYSSAVFDFAYLRKPVIYCQFDRDTFFSEHYKKGYFDYERDGFGEVAYDLEHLIDLIIEYAANGCKLKDQYRERIDRFFAFNDHDNCKRVMEKILALPDIE